MLYLVGDLHVSPASLGLIVGCGGAATLAAALVTPRLAAATPLGPGMILGVIAATVGMAMIPLASFAIGGPAVIGLLILGQVLGDFGLTYTLSLERTLRQHRIDNALLGRATVVVYMCGNVPGPLGAILAGIGAEYFGLTPVLWICVLGYALSPVVLLLSAVPRLKKVAAD